MLFLSNVSLTIFAAKRSDLISLVSVICLFVAEVKDRMLRASAEIKAWSVQNSQYRLPRRWHLSRAKLCLKSGKYCHYTGKAWHIFVILGFLCSYMEPLDVEGDLKMLVWSGHTLMAFLHSKRKESLFLAQDDIRQVQVLGTYHLNLLLLANQKFANFPTYKLFNIRPKFHSMCHILDFATSGKNPVSQACWMEEDWVRSVSVLAKRTHAKKTSLSTLQRYTAGQNIITRLCLNIFKKISGRIEACLGKAAGLYIGMLTVPIFCSTDFAICQATLRAAG